jgi:type IV fimbrial biogenesis protein FimT
MSTSVHQSRVRGFTLLEAMATIAVLAILLGLGVPAFTNIIRSNQIATVTNNLTSALNLARSEAMKRGVRVSVCPANAAATNCIDSSSWQSGLLVFSDDFGTAGVIDVGDEIIQVFRSPAEGVAVTAEDNATSVTFLHTAAALGSRSWRVEKAGCGKQQARKVSVSAAGRISLVREDCTT